MTASYLNADTTGRKSGMLFVTFACTTLAKAENPLSPACNEPCWTKELMPSLAPENFGEITHAIAEILDASFRKNPSASEMIPKTESHLERFFMRVAKASNARITDRRRERALAANPASEKPGGSKLKRGAAVRVHPFVGQPYNVTG